jgi:hypothetical protein
MKKIGLLCLALVLALGTLGIGYATWSDNVTVSEEINSGELCIRFTDCYTNDTGDELDKTIGMYFDCINTHNTSLCDLAALPYGKKTTDSRSCPLTKHVGSSNCTLVDRDLDGSAEVLISNAYDIYPSYYGVTNFSICNCGDIPWVIDTVDVIVNDAVVGTYDANFCQAFDLDGLNGPDLELWWGDNFGIQTDKGACYDMSFHWHLLQEAPQEAELEIKLVIHVIQWNMHPNFQPD